MDQGDILYNKNIGLLSHLMVRPSVALPIGLTVGLTIGLEGYENL